MLDEFQAEVTHAARHAPSSSDTLEYLVRQTAIRELIDWEVPGITDVTNECSAKPGRVRAIRMDLLRGANNLKKPVIAGLILLAALEQKFRQKSVDCLVDGGNMNSGFALEYYCERLGARAHYVMSRYFPAKMVDLIASNRVKVELAPPSVGVSLEREFYSYLVTLKRNAEFRKDKVWLWHAKRSARVMSLLGREMAASLSPVPDTVVTSLGSGASLALLLSAAGSSGARPHVVVAEHEASPILARRGCRARSSNRLESPDPRADSREFHDPGFARIPHSVLGPHYEELNPFIDPTMLGTIDCVQLYGESHWKNWSLRLAAAGLPVGNSSAAHLMVAAKMARAGGDVLTVIAEPLRPYYLERFWSSERAKSTGATECVA
ncbi:MAG TPA: pyridoxal-phosphate dependent enzyme [Vicinamibacterales bacterium]|nr:pyridoxal-phosphate dependent enzyme [Vicinamibacterales bacterium]